MRPIHSGTSAERGKPVVSPAPHPMGLRESNPQGAPTGQQVKEEGGSEGRPVMGRIGVERERAPREEQRKGVPPALSATTLSCRESGQTSLWSGVTREPDKQTSGGDADMSAAATLAGAVPSHGNMSCLLQTRIVEVSSGKRRQAESMRLDRTVGQFWRRGGSTSPHGRPALTAHQGETESDGLPRGGDRYSDHRQPLRHESQREEPRSARGACPGLSCMHRNGARTVLRGAAGGNTRGLPDPPEGGHG
jgi:hypothetical protein